MRLTLKNLLLLLVVLASSVAAFGVFGILATIIGVALGIAAASRQPSGETTFLACVGAARRWFDVLKTDRGARIRWLIALVLIVSVLVLLLLPKLQHVRESARRAACPNHLKQVGMALYNYHDDYGCFPPACATDRQGRRMHSWRTLIAPYFEEIDVAKVYNFDEPWDGPNNRRSAAIPLVTLRCPQATDKHPTWTSYLAVTGPGTAWPGDKSTRIADFADGTANTILLVEVANSGIPWTEPRDLTIEDALGRPGELPRVPSGHHTVESSYLFRGIPWAAWVLMADGSVHCLPSGLSREDLAALLAIDDGSPASVGELLERYEPSWIDSLRWDHCLGLPLFVVSLIWFWIRLLRDASNATAPEP